ncbi:MAG: Uma2 family endonuclease [Syntrophomonas sp.]|uniref:Uma2 family endonuclease n=1 Tax=Syntrophomonas sp. TaxID=2053627 RepID=UPI002613C6BA|nr:Uma2 family endonuclease [Syntrophomonas sp.]MDD2510876.1 Uma2 family endonuclease [Syntrophomonas sp.]MDD4626648.1 Uma2 family endonuclease [Syntrophomonas sp.]
MSMASPKPDKKYSYADYLQWPDEERWEIIDGVPYDMSPAPSTKHQAISMELGRQIANYLRDKECQVFAAPFDVRLPLNEEKNEEIFNIVQPDLSVICDPSKLDEQGCKGAPDLVIEIISPFTAKKELNEKFNLYERSGIPEYWVVFPKFNVVVVYSLDDEGRYQKSGEFTSDQLLSTKLFPGLEIKLEDVFR